MEKYETRQCDYGRNPTVDKLDYVEDIPLMGTSVPLTELLTILYYTWPCLNTIAEVAAVFDVLSISSVLRRFRRDVFLFS